MKISVKSIEFVLTCACIFSVLVHSYANFCEQQERQLLLAIQNCDEKLIAVIITLAGYKLSAYHSRKYCNPDDIIMRPLSTLSFPRNRLTSCLRNVRPHEVYVLIIVQFVNDVLGLTLKSTGKFYFELHYVQDYSSCQVSSRSVRPDS